jgi:hypothetical protein
MPAVAGIVPAYTDAMAIFAHDDFDGQRHAAELNRRLYARSIDAKVVILAGRKAVA